MNHDEAHDCLAAFALNSLNREDYFAVERHLEVCPQCAAELAELMEAASFLSQGFAPVEPPTDLRARVLARLPVAPRRNYARVAMVWAAAAAIFLVLGALWSVSERLIDTRGELGTAQREIKLLHAAMATRDLEISSQNSILAQLTLPENKIVRLAGTARGSARLVFTPGQEQGTLLANLEPLTTDKVYELWLISGKTPVAMGVFGSTGKSTSLLPVKASFAKYQVVAITIERGPAGASAPTTKPILVAKL
jgi:anti-sigma-K factor RskA